MDIVELSIYQKLGIHVVIGLVVLLSVLRAGLKDPFEREEIKERLGIIILITVFAWPYNLFCWVFSQPIWSRPVSELIPINKGEIVTFLVFLPGAIIIALVLAEMFGVVEVRLP